MDEGHVCAKGGSKQPICYQWIAKKDPDGCSSARLKVSQVVYIGYIAFDGNGVKEGEGSVEQLSCVGNASYALLFDFPISLSRAMNEYLQSARKMCV